VKLPASAAAEAEPGVRAAAGLAPLRGVSERVGLVTLADQLAQLQAWLGEDLGTLEAAIAAIHDTAGASDAGRSLAVRAADHLLSRAGKRIRPICVLLGARLGAGANPGHTRNAALASELVHAATLLHDDVIDEGVERRGAPTARMVFGNSASILAGDHLLVEALRLVRTTGHDELLDDLLGVISEMVAGEALQLERRGRFEPNRDVYLRVIEGKTAALFRWALSAGGALGGLGREQTQALGRAGRALGLAFQLIDDVLDLEGSEAVTGKSVLADLREGKLTWPLILAAERDPGILAEFRDLAAGGPDGEPARMQRILERVRRSRALSETRSFAQAQAGDATEALAQMRPSPARRAIELVVDSAIRRQH
jgi:octaprenyl-diphosphate synthase